MIPLAKKTLVILSPGFPSSEADSTCLPAQQVFVNTLKQTYSSLNIILLAFQYPFIARTYTWKGVRIISFNGQNRGKLSRLLLWRRVRQVLITLERENDIAGILSFWLGECAYIGSWFSKKYNLKHFIWLFGQDARIGNKFFKLSGPKSGELIAISDFIAKEFSENYSITPAFIIPLGIDPALFCKNTKEKNIDIIGAGSLIKLKQYDVFIDVIKLLTVEYPNLTVYICGDGPEKESLLRKIHNEDLGGTVILTGEVPHMELLKLLQHSRIFLHTSNYEGFSTVCLEALYAGSPVVSFIKPMNTLPANFFIAKDTGEMATIIQSLLAKDRPRESLLPYPAEETVRQIKHLFGV